MFPLTKLGLTRVRSSTMALADETLSHLVILIGFVTTLGKSDSSQLIKLIKLLHELLYGPYLTRLVKIFHEADDLRVVWQVYQRVVKEDTWVIVVGGLLSNLYRARRLSDDVRLDFITFYQRLKIIETERLWLRISATLSFIFGGLKFSLEAAVSGGWV